MHEGDRALRLVTVDNKVILVGTKEEAVGMAERSSETQFGFLGLPLIVKDISFVEGAITHYRCEGWDGTRLEVTLPQVAYVVAAAP